MFMHKNGIFIFFKHHFIIDFKSSVAEYWFLLKNAIPYNRISNHYLILDRLLSNNMIFKV